jgi:hypothetical protein
MLTPKFRFELRHFTSPKCVRPPPMHTVHAEQIDAEAAALKATAGHTTMCSRADFIVQDMSRSLPETPPTPARIVFKLPSASSVKALCNTPALVCCALFLPSCGQKAPNRFFAAELYSRLCCSRCARYRRSHLSCPSLTPPSVPTCPCRT